MNRFRSGIGLRAKKIMEELGKVHQLIVPLFGHNMVFNIEAIIMTWIVIAILIVFGIAATRKKSLLPGPVQSIVGTVRDPAV